MEIIEIIEKYIIGLYSVFTVRIGTKNILVLLLLYFYYSLHCYDNVYIVVC